MAHTKQASSREIAAMTFNLKEQRVLEKTLHTLSIEESYALKLVDLNLQATKVGHKRLKQRVARIKSHLDPKQIDEMQRLEARGKLQNGIMGNGLQSCSALRIQAASKRLKLWSDTKAAVSSASEPQAAEKITPLTPRSAPATPGRSSALNQKVTAKGVGWTNNRQWTADTLPLGASASQEKFNLDAIGPSKSNSVGFVGNRMIRPATAALLENYPLTAVMESPRKTRPVTSLGFNSHNTVDNNKEKETKNGKLEKDFHKTNSDARILSLVDEPDNLGKPDPYEERRQALIESESVAYTELNERRENFMQRVDKWIDENPSFEKQKLREANPYLNHTAREKRRRKPDKKKKRVEFKKFGEQLTEEEYKERLLAMWKDMNKCRYLRVSEDKIDLSGVQTLVKDQMKVFQMLRGNVNEEEGD